MAVAVFYSVWGVNDQWVYSAARQSPPKGSNLGLETKVLTTL